MSAPSPGVSAPALPDSAPPPGVLRRSLRTMVVSGCLAMVYSVGIGSPATMFIAAITGVAGFCGGVSAIAGGFLLARTADWTLAVFGRTFHHYHLLFALSLVLRLACIPLARAIREPGSSGSLRLVGAILDDWPAWLPRFPVGLYRRQE